MNDEPAPNAPTTEPTDEKAAPPVAADAHAQPQATEPVATLDHAPASQAEAVAPVDAPEPAVEQAEASVEAVTAPDPEHAPEPAPAAPPELAQPTAEAPASDEAEGEQAESETTAEAPTESAEPRADEEAAPAKPKKPRAKKAAPAEPDASVTPTAETTEPAVENTKKWYAIKVQSGREDSIKAAILRKVRIEGLEDYFGRIEIPVEEITEKKSVKVKDKKTGESTYQEKKVTRKKKKFQGYLFAELEFNDRILYLFRETSGVGDFLNLRQRKDQLPMPEPMPEHEVQSMLTGVAVKDPTKTKKIKIDFEKGDKVRIKEGPFANSEGEVKAITEAKDPNEAPKITVVLTFWGRPLDVEVDSVQVEKV